MCKYNKSTWGSGPWQDEPDELAWQDAETGLPCLIIRTPVTGSLCGYVGIPPGHVLFGWRYNDKIQFRPEFLEAKIDRDIGIVDAVCYAASNDEEHGVIPVGMVLHAHGGITWSGGPPREKAAHLARSEYWYFGFDCAHGRDYMPAMIVWDRALGFKAFGLGKSSYRTIDYVKGHCARLAKQLHQLKDEKLFTHKGEKT